MIIVHWTLASSWFDLFQGIFEFLSWITRLELTHSLRFSWASFRRFACKRCWFCSWFRAIWLSRLKARRFGRIKLVLFLRSRYNCVFLCDLSIGHDFLPWILRYFTEKSWLRLFSIFVSLFSDRLCDRLWRRLDHSREGGQFNTRCMIWFGCDNWWMVHYVFIWLHNGVMLLQGWLPLNST